MMREEENKTSKKQRAYRKKLFHEFEKISRITNITDFSRRTSFEQGFCCICDSEQSYGQTMRHRKTCGDPACVLEAKRNTWCEKKK